jgi:DNA-binding protein Fis
MMARSRVTTYRTLEEVEREHIQRVLETTRGNKTKAAKILGVDRRTLTRLGYKRERTRP